jgi:hypothetical protein
MCLLFFINRSKIQHGFDFIYLSAGSTYLHIHRVLIFTHDSCIPNLVIVFSLITHSTNGFRSFDDIGPNSCTEKGSVFCKMSPVVMARNSAGV